MLPGTGIGRSSPHTRGLPGGSGTSSWTTRRPRTGGGPPPWSSGSPGGSPSSPHARGLPLCRTTGSGRCSRPRTRGDLPGTNEIDLGTEASSPHARGSPAVGRRHTAGPPVVPARAGSSRDERGPGQAGMVVPHARGSSSRKADLTRPSAVVPHARGLPSQLGPLTCPELSSPHAPGSSAVFCTQGTIKEVVPARAGVFRPGRTTRGRRRSRPRTGGGLPHKRTVTFVAMESSPHARGSPGIRGPPRRPSPVVPARAGVSRRSGRCGSGSACRPRTRGVFGRVWRASTRA